MKKSYALVGITALLALPLLTGCSNQSRKAALKQSEASSLAKESSDSLDNTSNEDLLNDDDDEADTTDDTNDKNAETDITETESSVPNVNTSSVQLSGGTSINIPKLKSNQTVKSSTSNSINSPEQAIAAAKAKYGDQNGKISWNCMIDGTTGKPIKNSDGSYFVKGTTNDNTMTGTQYSLLIYPDGTIKEN